jgi:hypothetical protein
MHPLLVRAAVPALVLLAALAAPASGAAVFSRLDPAEAARLAPPPARTPGAALLRIAPEEAPATRFLAVDAAAAAAFRAAGGGRLALPVADGGSLELELEPYRLFADGAGPTYTDDTGRHPFEADVSLFRGRVAGEEGSSVVLAMSGSAIFANVERGGRRWTLSPAGRRSPGESGLGAHAWAREDALEGGASSFRCGIDGDNQAEYGLRSELRVDPSPRMAQPDAAQINAARFTLNLAVDCDYEIYGVKFGANLTTATAYVMTVLGTVNLIYERDLEATQKLVYLNLWTTSSDPYTQSSTSPQLSEFRSYWIANNGGISSHAQHLLSGRGLGGGIAFLDAICSGNAYGVSAIDCIYSYPTFTSTWDVNVVAHELGHNYGSPHTHSCVWAAEGRVPAGSTIDSCETAEGSCASYTTHLPPNKGTIMSYCHLIAGVANGVRLEFHSVCVSRMRSILSSCGGFPVPTPPRNPVASAIPAGVRLTWTNSLSPGVLHYSVVRSRLPLDLGAPFLGNTPSSPFDSPGLGLYFYRMRTVRAADSSAFSGEVTATACAFANASPVTVGSQPTAATAADLNEDGIQDVVLVTSGGGNLVTMLGQGAAGVGNGTFAAPVNVATGVLPVCLALLDANGDGMLDAVVGGQDANTLHLHLGQGTGGVGDGTFGAASLLASLAFPPSGIVVGDFDEDGLDDLVVAGGGSTLVQLRGQGAAGVPNGTFAAPVSITAGGVTRGVIAGDWNGDGVPDLATTGTLLRILYGNGTGGRGDGTFSIGPTYSTSSTPNHLATGDFDQDGVTDLAVCNTGGNSVGVYLGNGTPGAPDGTFAAGILVPAGNGPNAVQVADWDHDGRPDLAVASNNTNHSTSILLNQGGGLFDVAQTFPTGGNNPAFIAVQDFNEDGTPDLFACNRLTLSVTRQQAGCNGSLSSAITVTTPNGGEVWNGGTEHTLAWTKGPGVFKVDIQLSADGGASWRTLARGLIGTSFAWTATGPTTTQARIRVVDSHADQFADMSDADFSLNDESVVSVDVEAPRLALLGAWPNPARHDLAVAFALPAGGSGGTLELIDLAGRRVAARELSGLAAGRHQVALLERRALPPGVYLVRLLRGGEVRKLKVAVLR